MSEPASSPSERAAELAAEQITAQGLNITGSVLEGVQIGGVAGRDLTLTQIQGGVGAINVFGSVQVEASSMPKASMSTPSASAAFAPLTPPLTKREYQWRQVLLAKVKQYWIDGVLKKSLHTQVFIELGLSEPAQSPAQQPTPWVQVPTAEFDESSVPVQSFPEGAQAADIFADIGAGRTLLILGEPGAGKTVTLLKLADSLLARVNNDVSQPLPVVLNLSSWSIGRKPIADWLVQALYETYGASKSLCQTWIAQEQLILLLDGLDEVEARYRNDCVQALNQFIQSHGLTEMVVCSRIKDYEALSDRLKLRSAICIQPLTAPQIRQFLTQAGASLSELKAVLETDAEWQSMATSPLMLSIMSLTYQGCSASSLSQSADPTVRRQQLFEAYVDRLFARRSNTQMYERGQTLRWLTWLATYMVSTSQTVFWIERLQPSYLPRPQKRCYKFVLFAFLTFLLGTLPGFLLGTVAGVIAAAQESLGALGTGLMMVVGGVAVAVIFSLTSAVFCGVWLAFDRGEIRTVETLKWSWRSARQSVPIAVMLGLLFGFVSALTFVIIGSLAQNVALGMAAGLISFFYVWLCYIIMACLIGGMRGPAIAQTSVPNQGIFKSARNGLKFFLPSSVIVGCLVALWSYSAAPGTAIYWGIVATLWGGGFACCQHVAVRYVLLRDQAMPWHYARFLDHAADQLFLQKVGGGYIFIHRMLMEHFAAGKK